MTVKDIYKASVILATGEADMDAYAGIAVELFNLCLGKCFKENNHLRLINGKSPLVEMETVKSLDDYMPYETELATALKYALAAEILIADGETDEGKHIIYTQMFTNEVNKWGHMAIEERVVDVYGAD